MTAPRALVALLAAATLAGPLCASAVQTTYFPAQQAQSLDNAGVGARAMALGSAFIAVADDSTAMDWNPAGLAHLSSDVVGLHHNAWLGGITQDTLGLGLKTDHWGGVELGVNYVDDGSFDSRDSSGNLIGQFSANRIGLGLAWGGQITDTLDFGATA